MLLFNPNVRRKITYKIPVLFDNELREKKELYSYSIFTEDFIEKEIIFKERLVKIYEYNPDIKFIDSLKVFNEKNEMIKRFYFDLVKIEDSILVNKSSLVLEFKESIFPRNRDVCRGFLESINDEKREYYKLSFHRVSSFLGYKVKLNLFKNKEGDFIREEFYDSDNSLQYILENNYEYFESEIEKKALCILENGWDRKSCLD